MAIRIRRRDFIVTVGGATAWPLATRAQQTGKVFRIGFLGPSSPALERHLVDAFRQTIRIWWPGMLTSCVLKHRQLSHLCERANSNHTA
jgi:hypothetical protein